MRERDLIDEIVNEVFARLSSKYFVSRTAFVVGPMDQTVLNVLEPNYKVVTKAEDMDQYDIVLMTEISIERLAHLALACPMDRTEEMIIKTLLLGKNVYLLQQGIELDQYKDTAYKNLFLQYQEYLKQLKLYGMQIIGHPDEIRMPKEERTVPQMHAQNTSLVTCEDSVILDYTYKKVLLEKDVMTNHIHKDTMILLNSNCIITPLAEDYIRMHMIKVQRK